MHFQPSTDLKTIQRMLEQKDHPGVKTYCHENQEFIAKHVNCLQALSYITQNLPQGKKTNVFALIKGKLDDWISTPEDLAVAIMGVEHHTQSAFYHQQIKRIPVTFSSFKELISFLTLLPDHLIDEFIAAHIESVASQISSIRELKLIAMETDLDNFTAICQSVKNKKATLATTDRENAESYSVGQFIWVYDGTCRGAVKEKTAVLLKTFSEQLSLAIADFPEACNDVQALGNCDLALVKTYVEQFATQLATLQIQKGQPEGHAILKHSLMSDKINRLSTESTESTLISEIKNLWFAAIKEHLLGELKQRNGNLEARESNQDYATGLSEILHWSTPKQAKAILDEQSKDELRKIVGVFGLVKIIKELSPEVAKLVYQACLPIIHELDDSIYYADYYALLENVPKALQPQLFSQMKERLVSYFSYVGGNHLTKLLNYLSVSQCQQLVEGIDCLLILYQYNFINQGETEPSGSGQPFDLLEGIGFDTLEKGKQQVLVDGFVRDMKKSVSPVPYWRALCTTSEPAQGLLWQAINHSLKEIYPDYKALLGDLSCLVTEQQESIIENSHNACITVCQTPKALHKLLKQCNQLMRDTLLAKIPMQRLEGLYKHARQHQSDTYISYLVTRMNTVIDTAVNHLDSLKDDDQSEYKSQLLYTINTARQKPNIAHAFNNALAVCFCFRDSSVFSNQFTKEDERVPSDGFLTVCMPKRSGYNHFFGSRADDLKTMIDNTKSMVATPSH